MIRLDGAIWELSKEEKYIIKWLEEHDFDGELDKQCMSKTRFIVHKDDVATFLELQNIPNVNMKKFMEQFEKRWNMLYRYEKLIASKEG